MSMKLKPKISIITVNYNGYDHTCELIESLQRHVSLSYELIVVDNASNSDQASKLSAKYKDVTVVSSPVNSGFAGGNNMGIGHACGDYILLLNNDTFVEDNTLHYLVERIEMDQMIGAVSPKIRFAFEPRNIQFAGYTPLTGVTLRNTLIGFNTQDCGQYDEPRQVPYAHGAAMLFRREVLEQVGPMSTIFFLYYEELDWCERITRGGFQIWYEPRCTVFHKESATTGIHSPLRMRYMTRNRLLYAWRNRVGCQRVMSIAYQLLVAVPKSWVMCMVKGKFDLACAAVDGCAMFFKTKNRYN